MSDLKEKFSDYVDVAQVSANNVYNKLMNILNPEQQKYLKDFRVKYRSLCEHRQRLYDLQDLEENEGFLQEIVNEKVDVINSDAFKFSAQITYLERLIQAYEAQIPDEKIRIIKKYIFSEDDR